MHNQHDDMLHQFHHNRKTVQGIAEIITKDAAGNAGPDIGEVGDTSPTRSLLLSTSSPQQVSLSQVVPHKSFQNSQENDNGLTSNQFTYRTKYCKENTNFLKDTSDKRSFVSPKQELSHPAPKNQANEEGLHSPRNILIKDSQRCGGSLGSTEKQKSLKNKAGLSEAHLSSKESSNIYGGVGKGEFGFVGSWALQRKSGNMESEPQRDSVFQRDLMEAGENRQMLNNLVKEETESKGVTCDQGTNILSSNKVKATGSQWQFHASGGTLLQIRASHLVKLMCVMVLALAVFSVVFHSRIKVLEEEKKTLLNELGAMKMSMHLLANKMEDVISIAIPPKSQQRGLTPYDDEDEEEMEHNMENRSLSSGNHAAAQEKKRLVKRAAVPGRATKELMYTPESVTLNALNNESTSPIGPKFDDWTVGVDSGRTSKGNNKYRDKTGFSPKKLMRRLLRKEQRHRLEIKELKQKLKQIQQHIRLANLSCCNNDTSISSAHSSGSAENAQAVYLQLDGNSLDIKRPRQLIGPWYLPNTGNEIGFNDMWYNRLKLDSNGTSVVFQENGLFLISAQVFYKLQHIHNSKPTPMGYRVHIKKHRNENQTFRRQLTIAECVPSFPSTIYQTCFTQVVWYVEPLDEVYLEHCTDSLPLIEALRPGQTFLGLVKLS